MKLLFIPLVLASVSLSAQMMTKKVPSFEFKPKTDTLNMKVSDLNTSTKEKHKIITKYLLKSQKILRCMHV